MKYNQQIGNTQIKLGDRATPNARQQTSTILTTGLSWQGRQHEKHTIEEIQKI